MKKNREIRKRQPRILNLLLSFSCFWRMENCYLHGAKSNFLSFSDTTKRRTDGSDYTLVLPMTCSKRKTCDVVVKSTIVMRKWKEFSEIATENLHWKITNTRKWIFQIVREFSNLWRHFIERRMFTFPLINMQRNKKTARDEALSDVGMKEPMSRIKQWSSSFWFPKYFSSSVMLIFAPFSVIFFIAV